VSEQVHRKCSPRITTVQLLTSLYNDPEPCNSPPQKFRNFTNNGLWLYRTKGAWAS